MPLSVSLYTRNDFSGGEKRRQAKTTKPNGGKMTCNRHIIYLVTGDAPRSLWIIVNLMCWWLCDCFSWLLFHCLLVYGICLRPPYPLSLTFFVPFYFAEGFTPFRLCSIHCPANKQKTPTKLSDDWTCWKKSKPNKSGRTRLPFPACNQQHSCTARRKTLTKIYS